MFTYFHSQSHFVYLDYWNSIFLECVSVEFDRSTCRSQAYLSHHSFDSYPVEEFMNIKHTCNGECLSIFKRFVDKRLKLNPTI